MKNALKAIGKAAVYFGIYFLAQILVSLIYSVVLSAQLTVKMMAADGMLDTALLEIQLTEAIYANAMEMTLVSAVLVLLIYWLVCIIRRKKFHVEVNIRAIPVKGILPILLLAVCFNITTSVLVSMIPWPVSWMEAYMENASVIDNSMLAWVTAVLSAPISEEIVFRGFLYTRLKKGLPMTAAALLTSLLFGIVHGTVIWGVYTFIFSMVLIWVFERFQSLTACILLHMAYNLSGMALALIPENAGMVILLLFAASVVGIVRLYRQILSITADVGKEEFAEAETNSF